MSYLLWSLISLIGAILLPLTDSSLFVKIASDIGFFVAGGNLTIGMFKITDRLK